MARIDMVIKMEVDMLGVELYDYGDYCMIRG